MIDIRQVAKVIAELKIADAAARQAAVHQHLRNYGVELLTCLANAIMPTTPEEEKAVLWLKGEILKQAQQIPEPLQPKKKETTT